jgi:hypothetical protein
VDRGFFRIATFGTHPERATGEPPHAGRRHAVRPVMLSSLAATRCPSGDALEPIRSRLVPLPAATYSASPRFSVVQAAGAPGPCTVISIRRFFARSAGVLFGATGCVSPNPFAEMMFGLTPCEIR